MLARFRASRPDRCPQAAKSPSHPFGTRRGWWEKRELFEAGRTRPPRLVKPERKTSILQLFRWNSCNETPQRNTFLGKMVFSVRQKGVPPLLLPASVLQLPRCLVRICNSFLINHKIANLTVLKNAIAAGKPIYKNNLLRKCGLLANTLAAFLKNCCTKKLFICLRLIPSSPLRNRSFSDQSFLANW